MVKVEHFLIKIRFVFLQVKSKESQWPASSITIHNLRSSTNAQVPCPSMLRVKCTSIAENLASHYSQFHIGNHSGNITNIIYNSMVVVPMNSNALTIRRNNLDRNCCFFGLYFLTLKSNYGLGYNSYEELVVFNKLFHQKTAIVWHFYLSSPFLE